MTPVGRQTARNCVLAACPGQRSTAGSNPGRTIAPDFCNAEIRCPGHPAPIITSKRATECTGAISPNRTEVSSNDWILIHSILGDNRVSHDGFSPNRNCHLQLHFAFCDSKNIPVGDLYRPPYDLYS